MPDHEDSLGGETLDGDQADRAEQSLGDGATVGAGEASSLSDLSVGDVAEIANELPLIDLESRYLMGKEIGKGGMGVVTLARDKALNRQVAIKRILGSHVDSAATISRFATEARSIAVLNHYNIVQIHDVGRDKDGPLLVLEYVEGGSLLERLQTGKLEVEAAIKITTQMCDALAMAHTKGIIHRDIKPANILLTADGVPKLTDFGLARRQNANHGRTAVGAIMGTIDFMSPEQRRDSTSVDERSDLWSLAAVCYQMLTGNSPKVIRIHELPTNIADVIGKMLEENPDDRYCSAVDFKDALQSTASRLLTTARVQVGVCPACGTANELSRKFCSEIDCAKSLRTDCLDCELEIPLWDKICGECGANQIELKDVLLQDYQTAINYAEELLGNFAFDDAMAALTTVLESTREFAVEIVNDAKALLQRIGDEQELQHRRRDEATVLADKQWREQDYRSVRQTLEKIPIALRSQDCGEQLRAAIENETLVKQLGVKIQNAVKQRKYEGLIANCKSYLALKPNDQAVLALLGKLTAKIKEEQEKEYRVNGAILKGDWKTALAIDPRNKIAMQLKAADEQSKAIDAALRQGDWEQVLTLNPNHAEAMKMKREVEKLLQIKTALSVGDVQSVLELDFFNEAALEMRDVAIVENLKNGMWEYVLALDSQNAEALEMKGEAEQTRQLNAALSCFDWETALNLDPSNITGLEMRDVCIAGNLRNGKWEYVLSIDPKNAEALEMKAESEKCRRIAPFLSIGDFESILEIDSSNEVALEMRDAAIVESLLNGKWEYVLSLDPQNAEALKIKASEGLKAKMTEALKLDRFLARPELVRKVRRAKRYHKKRKFTKCVRILEGISLVTDLPAASRDLLADARNEMNSIAMIRARPDLGSKVRRAKESYRRGHFAKCVKILEGISLVTDLPAAERDLLAEANQNRLHPLQLLQLKAAQRMGKVLKALKLWPAKMHKLCIWLGVAVLIVLLAGMIVLVFKQVELWFVQSTHPQKTRTYNQAEIRAKSRSDWENVAAENAAAAEKDAAAVRAAILARDPITNTFGMTFKEIPAGTFMMGSRNGEIERSTNEYHHKVTITTPFYIQTTEVTQGHWQAVMGTEPWKGSHVKEGPNYAASWVSWLDAVTYCEKLSEKEGWTYRLPTEAEWEYACRAGTGTTWSFGYDENELGDYAWYHNNAHDIGERYAHQVGLKTPNAFGLYDMHGNVWEWCHDYYGPYPQTQLSLDPQGPRFGFFRVMRGGSWYHLSPRTAISQSVAEGKVVQIRTVAAGDTRSAFRYRNDADYRDTSNGFRVVRELD